ncbi:ABC transporter substrate-binding protein [Rhodoligotrophos ferricapiens]|uniref:ABC transporter substrate-binding protein n=1 Tax=Rhodoligotrophos ferricapiens TaxID=3069264 RepID=UPI00315C9414
MKAKLLGLAAALAVALSAPASVPVKAQDSIFIPLPTYRTGPFAGSGTHIANGLRDYLTMLNERDGGIGGVRLEIEECETGYDTQKGVECYQAMRGRKPVVFNPWSTGITLPLIPLAAKDKIPILSMAYGLSAAADGNVFPWIFNPPDTYWDGASAIILHIANTEGGLDKLKGKKIGFVFLDAGYGREPIPLLEQLASKYGFELLKYPVPAQQMQNQSSTWLNVRRDRPDWVYLQGWGAMNPTAIKEAAKTRFPMDKLISMWWPTEDDARQTGEGAKGFMILNFHSARSDFPALNDIRKFVVDKGLSQVSSPDLVGTNLYNRGVYNSVLIAEAIRTAQKLTGKKVITGEDMRIGLENLQITPERWAEIGFANFAQPVKLTCTDHSGHTQLYIQRWNGKEYEQASEWFSPMTDVVQPLLDKAAKEYVAANQPWPERTEACATN